MVNNNLRGCKRDEENEMKMGNCTRNENIWIAITLPMSGEIIQSFFSLMFALLWQMRKKHFSFGTLLSFWTNLIPFHVLLFQKYRFHFSGEENHIEIRLIVWAAFKRRMPFVVPFFGAIYVICGWNEHWITWERFQKAERFHFD